MNRKDLIQQQQGQGQDLDTVAAKLAIIGTAVSALGDGIATIAAVLALEASEQEKANSSIESNENQKLIKQMQQDIDYLKREMQFLKNNLR